ncbi:MAG: hypothetical protein U9P70_02900 [Patescibacteria group bacterium]|nr:hypothetical protein [Patescibacteria group bacterium]
MENKKEAIQMAGEIIMMNEKELLESLESEIDELSESLRNEVRKEIEKGYESAVSNLSDSLNQFKGKDKLILEGIIIILTELALS